MKKLIEPGYAGGKWRNEVEDKGYDEPVWRYLAYMQVADHWCTVVQRSATRHCLFLMGCLLMI